MPAASVTIPTRRDTGIISVIQVADVVYGRKRPGNACPAYPTQGKFPPAKHPVRRLSWRSGLSGHRYRTW